MDMKRFVIKTLLMLLPLVAAVVAYVTLIEPHRTGDLGKLGILPPDDDYLTRISEGALDTMRVVNITSLAQVEGDSVILTIGDSFSKQGRYGYQNCLATLYPGYTVFNLKAARDVDQYQLAVDMLRRNDRLPPIIIIECVERYLVERLADLDFSHSLPPVEAMPVEPVPSQQSMLRRMISGTSDAVHSVTDEVFFTQDYLKKWCGIDDPVHHLKLNRRFFTYNGDGDDLYFYGEDLVVPADSAIQASIAGMDSLLNLVHNSSSQVFFLVAADKYDVYRNFAVNNPYGWKGQLQYFTKYNSDFRFINTLPLLLPHVEQGELDVYRCNDTHWSVKAAQYVAREIDSRIKADQYNRRQNTNL